MRWHETFYYDTNGIAHYKNEEIKNKKKEILHVDLKGSSWIVLGRDWHQELWVIQVQEMTQENFFFSEITRRSDRSDDIQ